jgi:hypothetical protein
MSDNTSEISTGSSDKPAMSIFENPDFNQREKNKKAYRGMTKVNKPDKKLGKGNYLHKSDQNKSLKIHHFLPKCRRRKVNNK